MSVDSAHKRGWEIAEVVFGIPFLASIAIQWVIPLAIVQGSLKQILIPAGIALIAAGIIIIVLARRELARFRQPTDPGQPTSEIVKTGVFAISRNPLYLGAVLFILGFALALNNLWMLIMLLLSIILSYPVLILPEENYLKDKFGAAYQDYAAAVSRWIGRK